MFFCPPKGSLAIIKRSVLPERVEVVETVVTDSSPRLDRDLEQVEGDKFLVGDEDDSEEAGMFVKAADNDAEPAFLESGEPNLATKNSENVSNAEAGGSDGETRWNRKRLPASGVVASSLKICAGGYRTHL